MYDTKLRFSNCSRCYIAEKTLDSFLQVFTNFKASFCKPINFYNICNNNICDNTLNCNLKIFYKNVRGLKTKLVSLRCSFPMFHFYDIIILTETWLTPDISDSELGFAGFQVIRHDRNHNNITSIRGGGVIIAIKNTRSFHATVSNVEQVFVLLSLNSRRLLVGGVYLPPRSPLSVVESHTSSVEHIISSYKPNSLVICGDYNLPNIN